MNYSPCIPVQVCHSFFFFSYSSLILTALYLILPWKYVHRFNCIFRVFNLLEGIWTRLDEVVYAMIFVIKQISVFFGTHRESQKMRWNPNGWKVSKEDCIMLSEGFEYTILKTILCESNLCQRLNSFVLLWISFWLVTLYA